MATISDPAVNNWWDSEARPLAEDFERLIIRLRSCKARYTSEISAKLASSLSDDRLDLREGEGVPISTKDEMITWESNAEAMLAAVDGTPGRESVLTYPAVRPPV